MDFAFSEEEIMIRDTARRQARERLAPFATTLDRGGGRAELLANLKSMAQAGFMALNVSAIHGGAQAGVVAFALSIMEFGQACAATTGAIAITNMVAEVIEAVGTADQKAAHLPRIADGTYSAGSFCLTEAGAGSDPAAIVTRAVREADSYVLNGEKLYISSADMAGIFVVWAVTDPARPRGKGISCFLVEAGTPGLSIGKPEEKMGQTGSPTNAVRFDNCRVPASALMGREHDGFRIAVGELAGGRIGVAALSWGIARAAMDAAIGYVKERKQFGTRLADFQGLQWMIADRETELEAARLLILSAAAKKDRKEPYATAASMAKLYASEAAHRATDTAIQLFGGAGYLKDYPVERLARDARITRLYEGTSEIQRLISSRDVLRQ